MSGSGDAVWAPDMKQDAHERLLRDAEKTCVLLRPSPRRFVLFPIQHKQIWDQYKLIEHSFWAAEDFDLDLASFSRMPSNVQLWICDVLDAFLQASQALRHSGVIEVFADELQAAEARCYYGFQGMLENIHVESLSTALLRLAPSCGWRARDLVGTALATFLVDCASRKHSFMRRLLVHALLLDYYSICVRAASNSLQHTCAPLAMLLGRIARDMSRFAAFAQIICRMTIPANVIGSAWQKQLAQNTLALCVGALPNIPRAVGAEGRIADAFTASLSRSLESSTHQMLTPTGPSTPRKETEASFVFSCDDDF